MRSLIAGILWLGLVFGIFIGWKYAAFPAAINFGIQHDGASAPATITKTTFYKFKGQGRGGSYYPVDTMGEADSMAVSVSYAHHASTIFIKKTDAQFLPLYFDTQANNTIAVRYLRLMPGIVHLASD